LFLIKHSALNRRMVLKRRRQPSKAPMLQAMGFGMRKYLAGVGVLLLSVAATGASASPLTYNFTELTAPAGSGGITALGINDAGTVVGYYNGTKQGFMETNGVFTPLSDPLGGIGAIVTGINDSGTVVGYYGDATGFHGFTESNGNWNTLDAPLWGSGHLGTFVEGINNDGTVVGYNWSNEGFTEANGVYTQLIAPNASPNSNLEPSGINDNETVVGTYDTASQNNTSPIQGFMETNGVFTPLSNPLATGSGVPAVGGGPLSPGRTDPLGINDNGTVVGYYDVYIPVQECLPGTCIFTNYPGENGFIYSNGVWTTIDDPNAINGIANQGTWITGINNEGTIVGNYDVSNGVSVAFIATAAVPEPPTWTLMLAGLFSFAGFAAYRRRKQSGADLAA
jgi:hypothetical protein